MVLLNATAPRFESCRAVTNFSTAVKDCSKTVVEFASFFDRSHSFNFYRESMVTKWLLFPRSSMSSTVPVLAKVFRRTEVLVYS